MRPEGPVNLREVKLPRNPGYSQYTASVRYDDIAIEEAMPDAVQ